METLMTGPSDVVGVLDLSAHAALLWDNAVVQLMIHAHQLEVV